MKNGKIVYKKWLTNKQFNKIIQIIDDNLERINVLYGRIEQFETTINNKKYSVIEFPMATWNDYAQFIILFDENGVRNDFCICDYVNIFIKENEYLFSCPIDNVIELINNVLLN